MSLQHDHEKGLLQQHSGRIIVGFKPYGNSGRYGRFFVSLTYKYNTLISDRNMSICKYI